MTVPFSDLIAALGGGALIGLAALLLFGGIGRIAGVSGIIGGLIGRPDPESAWRISFLVGIAAGAWSMGQSWGRSLTDIEQTVGFVPVISATFPQLIVAGLLVGYGTSLGSGCTSGHGICGLARVSPRSFAAVLVFMAVAALTTFITRHVLGD